MRSVANSRVRCAIVIESELAITNAPTKSAMPPKASRKSGGSEMNSFVSSASSAACVVAGPHLRARRAGSSRSPPRARSGETPGLAATRIWSSLPTLSKSCCAVGRSKPASVAPPIVSTRAELDEAGDAELLDRPLGLDADLLARPRGPSSTRSRRRSRPRPSLGHAPLDERERVELGLRRVDAEAEVRRAAEDDRLAVLADQLRLAADAADRRLRRPAAPATVGEQRLGERRRDVVPLCRRGRTPTCR